MESALKKSEQAYRQLVESAADSIFSFDRQGRFVFINAIAARYFNVTPEKMIGTRMWDWFPKEIADAQWRDVLGVFESGVGKTTESMSMILGRPAWFSMDMRPVLDLRGEIVNVQLIARDITPLIQATGELRQARDFLDEIVNTIADPVFVKDQEHRYILVNDAFCVFTGQSRAATLGRSDLDMFPQGQAEFFIERDLAVMKTGQEDVSENEVAVAQGAQRVVVTKKTLYQNRLGQKYIVGVIRDITERKKQEREREEMISRLQDALANIKTLRGLIPVCATCKKIRNDRGYWQQVDDYVREHSDAVISHGLCHECAVRLYPEVAEEIVAEKAEDESKP
jgi:PAS domain S-box-containing protein